MVERIIRMKSLGIIRKIDEVGRLVLPKELRETMDIDCKTPFEIYTDKDTIILKKYMPSCIFCGEAEDVTQYCNKNICKACIKKIAKL